MHLINVLSLEYIYRCELWVDTKIVATSKLHINVKESTSRRYLDFGLFVDDAGQIYSFKGRIACVAFANFTVSQEMVTKHMKMCGTAVISPCSDVSKCECSNEVCGIEYVDCPSEKCKDCQEHCCCLPQGICCTLTV